MNKRHLMSIAALASIGAVTLAGCSSLPAKTVENGDAADVKIAVFNGWDEGIAVSELWKSILTEKGYDVDLAYAEAAPVYSGLSTDDYDVTLDTWLPITHQDYIDEYGDDLTDLGAWNDDARLTVAVNEDAPIDSLEELAASSGQFGDRLVGIEPGSGLNRITTEAVIPGYGLDDMEYLTSSTPAMLSELKAATKAGENIAVTLWRPHWAYDAFPIKDLADPQGLLGDAEGLHSFGGKTFTKTHPTLAGWLQHFTMDTDRLASLENALFNGADGSDDYAPAVGTWISQNQLYVDGLTAN